MDKFISLQSALSNKILLKLLLCEELVPLFSFLRKSIFLLVLFFFFLLLDFHVKL